MKLNDFGLISRPYSEARVVIVPVPFEGTVTYGKGASGGPAAIIDASQNAETFDPATGKNYEKLALHTAQPLAVQETPVSEVMAAVEESVTSILTDNKFPFLLGGEHSITGAAVRAVAGHYGPKGSIGVLQLDAHADLRNEYEGSIHNHACVMARVREVAQALQLGVRSCSVEEYELIKKESFAVLDPKAALNEKKLERALSDLPEKLYLTIDLDALDPSVMPATGTPEPGGFSWDGITSIIKRVAAKKTIVGADCVELAPIPGMRAPDFLAARLVFYILGEIFLDR